MIRNVFLFLALLVGIAHIPAAYAAQTYDMAGSVEQGLKANPSVKAARSAVKAAEHGRKSARGSFGPAASVNYNYLHRDEKPTTSGVTSGDQDSWTLHLNVSQPLFTGLRILSTYEKAALSSELSQSELEDARLALTQAIQVNFLELLKARADVKSAQDSLERLKSQLQVTRSFFDVGLRPRLDVLQAEVDAAQAEQNLVKAENYVETQRVRLHTLLNLPPDSDTVYEGELEYMPFLLDLDECLERAYQNRPDLMIAAKSVEIAKKDSKISASAFYPSISADFDLYRQGDDPMVDGSQYKDPTYWTAGVNLSWTFFEWGKNYHAYKQARGKVSQLQYEADNLQNEISYEVKSNFLSLRESEKRIEVAKAALAAAKESYRMAQARYQAQVGTNTDVLDAQAKLTQSEADLTQALADYQQALAKLYRSMGVINPSLSSN